MRVLPDTNIFISALMFPNSKPATVLLRIGSEHQMVLSQYVIDEVIKVVELKYPKGLSAAKELFTSMSFELISENDQTIVEISDIKDQPILNAAIAGDVDVIVSGDKHFKQLSLKKPRVLSPAEFIDLLEHIEDEHDLRELRAAMAEHEKNPVTISHAELMKEFGLDGE